MYGGFFHSGNHIDLLFYYPDETYWWLISYNTYICVCSHITQNLPRENGFKILNFPWVYGSCTSYCSCWCPLVALAPSFGEEELENKPKFIFLFVPGWCLSPVWSAFRLLLLDSHIVFGCGCFLTVLCWRQAFLHSPFWEITLVSRSLLTGFVRFLSFANDIVWIIFRLAVCYNPQRSSSPCKKGR